MKRISKVVIAVLTMVACLFVVGCAGEVGSLDNAITVSASATAQVNPDKATIGFMLYSEGNSSDEASVASQTAVGNVLETLKGTGVAEENVKTESVDLGSYVSGGTFEVIDGYEDEWGNWVSVYDEGKLVHTATTKVVITDFDTDKLAQVLQGVARAGATSFVDLAFTVSDRDAAYQQALNSAVEAAHTKAESLAAASGVYLGRLVNLVEEEAGSFETTVKKDTSALNPKDKETLNITPSQIPVEANVTVSYAIS